MTRIEAIEFLCQLLKILGRGYHPDEKLDQYVYGPTGKPTFSLDEVEDLQAKHDLALNVLKHESYDIINLILGY